jgi:hypothetical protein
MLADSPPAVTVRSKPLFGYRTQRTLLYTTSGAINTGAGSNAAYIFQANGCYDPDITGTGFQPMGFDQMMLLYNHYTPIRCKCTILANNASTTQIVNIGISVMANTTVITDYWRLVENGDLTFHQLGFSGQRSGCCKLERTIDIAKFEGIDDPTDDPTLRGDVTANPTEGVFFHINMWNPYSVDVVNVQFQVLLEFTVVFQEPRILTRSLRMRPDPKEEKEVDIHFDNDTLVVKPVPVSSIPIAYAFMSNYLTGRLF